MSVHFIIECMLLALSSHFIQQSKYIRRYSVSKPRKAEFDSIANKLGLKTWEDWYKVAVNDSFVKEHGTSFKILLKEAYGNSLSRALIDIYPERNWKSYRFHHLPPKYWQNKQNQKLFLDDLYDSLGLKSFEDWYQVTKKVIIEHGGEKLLEVFKNNRRRLLVTAYPDHPWDLRQFDREPTKPKKEATVKPQHSEKDFFDRMFKEFKFKNLNDWYGKTADSISQIEGGKPIMTRHKQSLFLALKTAYPDHDWKPWRFNKAPHHFWEDIDNQKEFFRDVMKEIGIKDLSKQWENVTAKTIREQGGSVLLKMHGGSPRRALKAAFPELDIPKLIIDKEYESMQRIGEKLNIQTMEDWYSVTKDQIAQNGGAQIMMTYNDSPARALMSIYPTYDWKFWRFDKTPSGFWEDEVRAREFMDECAKNFNIKSTQDWIHVSGDQIRSLGGSTLLHRHGGIIGLIQHFYGDTVYKTRDWQAAKTQMYLFREVQELFPEMDVNMDFLHPDMRYQGSNKNAQLDVYVPGVSLAFEFQGPQHYSGETSYTYKYQADKRLQIRDAEKLKMCNEKGITLILVPYWWDLSRESLVDTIRSKRNDLLKHQ